MKNNAIALTHPVRLPVVGKYIGQLLLVLALLTVVPLVVALVFGDYTVALSYTTILVLQLAISVPASRMAAPTRIQANEARVITRIENSEYEHICIELGLEDTIVPARTIGGYLADMFEGHDPLVLSTMIRDEARAFSFVAPKQDAGPIGDLGLPQDSRVVCIYRDDKFILPDDDTSLKIGDEVVLITHRRNVEKLTSRWAH